MMVILRSQVANRPQSEREIYFRLVAPIAEEGPALGYGDPLLLDKDQTDLLSMPQRGRVGSQLGSCSGLTGFLLPSHRRGLVGLLFP